MNNEIKEMNLSEMLFNRDERLLDCITNLQEKLEISQTNEETYRLEMQDITKILGLDEHTLFDEVKEYATNLQEEIHKKEAMYDSLAVDYRLSQEKNERLKEIINDDMAAYLKGLEDGKDKMKECYDSIYKSRNEKAIEYINNLLNSDDIPLTDVILTTIKEVLGGDEEC